MLDLQLGDAEPEVVLDPVEQLLGQLHRVGDRRDLLGELDSADVTRQIAGGNQPAGEVGPGEQALEQPVHAVGDAVGGVVALRPGDAEALRVPPPEDVEEVLAGAVSEGSQLGPEAGRLEGPGVPGANDGGGRAVPVEEEGRGPGHAAADQVAERVGSQPGLPGELDEPGVDAVLAHQAGRLAVLGADHLDAHRVKVRWSQPARLLSASPASR